VRTRGAALLLALLAACGGGGDPAPPPAAHPLDHLEQAVLHVRDEPYLVWIARTPAEMGQGLKGITEDEIAPLPDGTERGMLFAFAVDLEPAFTMEGTIIPLDLAFLRSDGTIVETYEREPGDATLVQPAEPRKLASDLLTLSRTWLNSAEASLSRLVKMSDFCSAPSSSSSSSWMRCFMA